MKTEDIKRLDGWRRAGIAVSILWIIIATTTYSMSLGAIFSNELTLADVLPSIVLAWRSLGFSLFEYELLFPSGINITPLGFSVSFNVVGYFAYVLIPIAAMWIWGYMVAWVVAGFQKR